MDRSLMGIIEGISLIFILMGWGIFFWFFLWQVVKMKNWDINWRLWGEFAYYCALMGVVMHGVFIAACYEYLYTDGFLHDRGSFAESYYGMWFLLVRYVLYTGLSLVLMRRFLSIVCKNSNKKGLSDVGMRKLRRLSSGAFPVVIICFTLYAVDCILPRFDGGSGAIFPLYIVVMGAVSGLLFLNAVTMGKKADRKEKTIRREKGSLLFAFVLLKLFFFYCMIVVYWYKGGEGLLYKKQGFDMLVGGAGIMGMIAAGLLLFSKIKESTAGIWTYSLIILLGIWMEIMSWLFMLDLGGLSLIRQIIVALVGVAIYIYGVRHVSVIRKEYDEGTEKV